jgi:hypothetical protein
MANIGYKIIFMAYNDLIKEKIIYTIVIPETLVPTPNEVDYSNGIIKRYFVQKSNDDNGHIFEVKNDTYETYLENPYWKGVELFWRIEGPKEIVYKNDGGIEDIGVYNSNMASINIASTKLKNIGLYLPNILQFHKG